MDRIYGVDNYINNMFINYAKEQKMTYREQEQVYHFIIYLPNGEITDSKKYPLKVKLNCKDLKYLPYMDSLYIWDKWRDTFSTSYDDLSNIKFYKLKNTYGSIGKPGLKILGIKIKNDN
jgi:hypothetical protein